MKRLTISTALYVSFLSFALLALFFGETGVSSLERLNRQREQLTMNLGELDRNHDGLAARLESLRRDPQAIVVEARSLGLYPIGENVLLFENFSPKRTLPHEGIVLNPGEYEGIDEGLFRIIAMSLGIATLLVSLVFWKLRDAHSA